MKRKSNTTSGQHSSWRALHIALGAVAGIAGVAAATILSAQNAPAGVAAAATLPAGPGRDLVAAACSSCHAIGLATGKRHTPAEWTQLLNKMVEYGVKLSDPDLATVHTYLAQNFAPVVSAVGPIKPPVAPKAAAARFPRPAGPNQWPAYGGGGMNQNYSDLTQITPANVAKLQAAWTYHYGAGSWDTGDQGLDFRFEVTPLIIGGVMYVSTPSNPAMLLTDLSAGSSPPRRPSLAPSISLCVFPCRGTSGGSDQDVYVRSSMCSRFCVCACVCRQWWRWPKRTGA